MATQSSPDGLQLRGKPKSSARLNRKALFALGGVLVAIVVFILSNITDNSAGKTQVAEKQRARIMSAEGAGTEITKAVPDNAPRMTLRAAEVPELQSEPDRPALSAKPAQAPASTPQDPELAQALRSETAIVKFVSSDAPPTPSPQPSAASGAQGQRRDKDALDATDPANEPDLNRQSQKREFLDRAAKAAAPTYRVARAVAPITAFEVKTGSVIPAILITEINSDLPGQIVAQVSQNIFDSATGRHLLIPQGTKLFGQYDSSVTFGQERLMVAWLRLIYPNASTLDLGGMAGIDKQGQSGFSDQVNNHWMRTIGGAVLMSLFTAGVQISQPQPAAGSTSAVSPQQAAAASLGQQMGQLGMAVANRNLRVQPTIEIRRGHQFAVMVSKDLVFESAYQDKPLD